MFCLQKLGPNEKPLPASREQHRKIQQTLQGIIGFCLFLIVVRASSNSKSDNIYGTGLLGPDREKGSILNVKCSTLEKFQICSHRLLEPPDGAVAGSLSAMTSFWNHGVRCFDIDAVTTKDGQLIAAHPEILAPRITPKNIKDFDPGAFTLDEMRSLGADEERHPLLDKVLEHYASLVNSDKTTRIPYFLENSEHVQGSLFHLDLKGPNLNAKHVHDVQGKLIQLGIQNNVAICAGALKDSDIGPGYDILKHLGQDPSRASICLVLRDREENDRNVERVHDIVQNNQAIRSYASSYKFEKDYFSQIRGKPIITWTIDTEDTLIYSIESGAAGVVTNHPMKLQGMLQGFIKKGQCIGG